MTEKKRRSRKQFRKKMRSITKTPFAVSIMSRLAIWYLKLVHKTNRYTVEPADILEQITPIQPVIVAVWHGQHILLPVIPIGLNASAMISKNLDGDVTARIVEHFGNSVIRASGGRQQKKSLNKILEKGGISGFIEMLNTLRAGKNVVQTADIPKGTPRRAGAGIIALAQRSGAPIVPMAIASSRRYIFEKAWDRATINMPFGRTAICVGNLVYVSDDSDDDALEMARVSLEEEMHRITERAYELTGNPE